MKSIPKLLLCVLLAGTTLFAHAAPASWQDSLEALPAAQLGRERAAHLLERAGFGGTPAEVDRFAAMSPQQAVRTLVRYQRIPNPLPPFEESGAFDPGLDPFVPSRPAATDMAKETGEALGVKAKPAGNRRLQQAADRFLYWLRATKLESQRIGYWWANRMLLTKRPLEEKMTLFWHGHFATSDEKVRDYRKMLKQNEMLRARATGNFRDLLIAVAQDPAMLAYLDAAVNVKGAPNENFAREIMELFSMGVGNYSEQDIREAARAFTGWNFKGLQFVVNPQQHDDGVKRVLGRSGRFDGVQVIDIILAQPVTSEYIATKLYRYFVREDVSPQLRARLGRLLRDNRYEIAPFLEALFLSQDFFSDASVGSRIKPPVELVVSTYRKMGLAEIPGIPDFNDLTDSMGQKLLLPPNVAGWSSGKSWITPGLLLVRGNFVYDAVFPPIDFVANDRVPAEYYGIIPVAAKLALGKDVTTATRPDGKELTSMSMQNDRNEDFNTRLASYHAWRKAIEKVKPIPRAPARLDLARLVRDAGCQTAQDAVDHLLARFLVVPVDADTRTRLGAMLAADLGTDDLKLADSYMEDALRNALHVILSLPTYQLG
ncbi:MAG: hypothetical protein RJA36_2108 [Pseudomonadota bacterium]|jgi:uncharacterized protein (DUF1800 family)